MTLHREVWLQQLRPRLLAFVSGRVSSAPDAEDIVQDVLLKVHSRSDSLQDGGRLEAWAFKITRNAVVDAYRRRAARREDPVEVLEIAAEAPGEDTAAEVRRHLVDCLDPLLDQVAAPYREALELVELGSHSQKEAAEILGLSASGARTRVQRGRAQLEKALDECCTFELDGRNAPIDAQRRPADAAACGCTTANG